MGLKIDNVKQKPIKEEGVADFMSKDLQLFSSSLTEKDKERIYSSLSTLLNSGIDLNRSLEIVSDELKQKHKKGIVNGLVNMIQSGATLSEALEKNSNFSKYEIYTVKIGEEVGNLGGVLTELQNYYKGNIKRKRMLMSALSYPILVVGIAIAAVLFMVAFVIPMFQDIFKRFKGDLPDITKAVINISEFIQGNVFLILMSITVFIVSLFFLIRIPKVKLLLSKLLMKIPFIGPFIIKTHLSNFSGVMSMLLGSGVHLLRALQLSKNVISFLPFKEVLEKSIVTIEQGGTMYDSFDNKALFPNKFKAMIKVGEEVNKLDTFFAKAHEEYNNELEHSTSVLGIVIEPLLLVFLGGLIGTILVAMYLPLFELSNQW